MKSLTDLLRGTGYSLSPVTFLAGAVAAFGIGCSNPNLDALSGNDNEDPQYSHGVARNYGGNAAPHSFGNAGYSSDNVHFNGTVRVASPTTPMVDAGDAGSSDAQDNIPDASIPHDGGLDAGDERDAGSSDAQDNLPDASIPHDGGLDASGQPDGSIGADAGSSDAGTECQNPIRWYNDSDHDGYRSTQFVEGCTSTGTFTLREDALIDCDDDNVNMFQYLNGARDADNDTFTVGPLERICTGTELPAGRRGVRSAQDDCDDNISSCTTDCVTVSYINSDGDAARGTESRRACDAPIFYNLPNTAPIDCDDENEAVFQYLLGARDADNDTFTFGVLEPVCSGTELPFGWRLTRSTPEDCDDAVSLCNTDCVTPVYGDLDGDGARNAVSYRACDTPAGSVVSESAPIDCDDRVVSCTTDCTTLQYVDSDSDGLRGDQSHRVCDASAEYILTATAVVDCDDAVASCTTDCDTLLYINADNDTFRGRGSHRSCDAPVEYSLPASASIDCDDTTFNTTLEDVIVCGINQRGRQTRRCVDGEYQVDPCSDSDECLESASESVTCSRNVGICREGNETRDCTYNGSLDKFEWVLRGDCDGILPAVEDPDGVPTLLDENCDGVAMRAYKIPVGLVYVGCDVTIEPARCNGSGIPMHPAELPELLDANGKIIHRLLTDEIPLLLYRECVSQGVCTDPADRRSRTDNGYYSNPVKINGGYPVTATTWMQSRIFCAWLSGDAADIAAVQADPFVHRRLKGDLPTEAEWFMAANGSYAVRDETGTVVPVDNAHATTHYTWGNESPNCTRANFRDPNVGDCFGDFQPVYSLPAGAGFAGAHHMNGNGVEWLFNIFENYTGGPESIPDYDPMGPAPTGTSDQRVKMGGDYLTGEGSILTSGRFLDVPDRVIRITAFRCVVRSPYEP